MENKMELLAMDIYKWCMKKNLWGDNIIYFNGKAWSSSPEWSGVKGKEIGDRLYEYKNRNPKDYFPGGDSVLSMSYEGSLNHVLNAYVPGWVKLESQFYKLFDKYGLVFEPYNSWNGNAYPIRIDNM